MKFIAVALILVFSQSALALRCESQFKDSPFQRIGKGAEGTVYRHDKVAKKVFEYESTFDTTLKLHVLLAEPLAKAGFKIPEILQLESENLTIYREFVAGETISAFHRKSMARFQNRKSWEPVRAKYESLFKKAISNLQKGRRFKFEREKSEEHISVIEGVIHHNGEKHYVRIHEDNIIVRIDSKTKEPQLYIIDYR